MNCFDPHACMHGASIRATRSPDRGRTEGVGSRDPLRPSLLYCADYHTGGQSQWRSGSRRNPKKPYEMLCARANVAAGPGAWPQAKIRTSQAPLLGHLPYGQPSAKKRPKPKALEYALVPRERAVGALCNF